MSHWDVFDQLPVPQTPGAYTVAAEGARIRPAKGSLGSAALLIAFKHRASSTPRRLMHLTYVPTGPVELKSAEGDRRVEHLAILECQTNDRDLQRYFFQIVHAVLADQRAADSSENFERALDKLVVLFRALRRPAIRSIQGVWAELAIVCWASEPAVGVSAWHSSPTALHDFASGDFKLEVKSSRSGLREHHFRLAQLAAIQTGETIVASLLVTESGAGVSVHDLVDTLRENPRLPRESLARIETVLAETLGEDWHRAADVHFDLERARASLKFYRALDIPSIPQPLPSGIKEVQFVADLSNAPEQDLQHLRTRAKFFAALLPADVSNGYPS